jgi:hypothetical protein
MTNQEDLREKMRRRCIDERTRSLFGRIARLYPDFEQREIFAGYLNTSFLEAYQESVMSRYHNEVARRSLLKTISTADYKEGSLDNGLYGSDSPLVLANIPRLIHLTESGLLQNSRLAKLNDLIDISLFGLKGFYICSRNDVGILLQGEKVSYAQNKSSAESLVAQLKKRRIELGKGIVIPLYSLTHREDPQSGYGLTLDLKDNFNPEDIRRADSFHWVSRPVGEGLTRVMYLPIKNGLNAYELDLTMTQDDGKTIIVSPKEDEWMERFIRQDPIRRKSFW